MVRAKMHCQSIQTTDCGYGTQYQFVNFSTVYDPNIPEDQRFQKATPCGDIKMQIDNPEALKQFQPGKSYYVDFTPAE